MSWSRPLARRATTDAAVIERRSFMRAYATGATASLAASAALLARAPQNQLTTLLGSIHDHQARALFDGHFHMPFDQLAIEAFNMDGEYQTYFGIWPTLLRMPVLAVTSRFDGRLTGVSMLLALALAFYALARLHWNVRSFLHGDAPAGERSPLRWWALAGFATLIGVGSIVTFLSSRPLVYHEMELWGITGALLTASGAWDYLKHPSLRAASGCGVGVAIALLSRPSVGFGAIATIGTVAMLALVRRQAAATIVALVAAVAVPVVMYCAVNIARFDAPFALPLERQVFSQSDAQRQAALAANDGSLFGVQFAPTTAMQYLRPDALRFTTRAPFVDFPQARATVIGDVVFDTLDRSTSLTASMPALCILGVLGAVGVWKQPRGSLLRPFAVAVAIGGAVGSVAVLTIAFVANRYLADFTGPLVVFAVIGFEVVAAAPASRRRRVATGTVAALALFSAWVSVGTAIVYQRELRPGDPGWGRGTEAQASSAAPVLAASATADG